MRTVATLSLALLVSTCGPSRGGPAAGYPGELQPPSAFPHDFLLQQELTVERGEESHRFRAALQRETRHWPPRWGQPLPGVRPARAGSAPLRSAPRLVG